MDIWIVTALCLSLKGQCAWSPPSPMPSRVACTQFGRKLQLERNLPMNSFRCLKVEVKG
jgi:hypothetical protein